MVALLFAPGADIPSPRSVLASLQTADNSSDLETVLFLYAGDADSAPPERSQCLGQAGHP